MDELRQKSANTANRKRKELVTEGARLRLEVQDRIQTLTTQLEGSRVKVANLEKILADVEREERLKVVKAPKEGGKLGILTGLAKERIDEMKSQLTRVRSQRDAGRGRISELEEILRAFKDEYDPNFNDEGVKRAVKKWEDYATRDKEPDDSASERDLDDVLSSDAEINWAEFETEEESEVAVCQLPSFTLTGIANSFGLPANPHIQCISLRNTFRRPSASGLTLSSVIYALTLSTTASSPPDQPLLPPESLPP